MSTQLDLETQLAEAKVRIAALEAALAEKEKVDPATECCGFSRKEVAQELESLFERCHELTLAQPMRAADIEYRLDLAVEALKLFKGEPDDSEWDCSCATPEMCRGECGTHDCFCEWTKEEKAKGATHTRPVHDFKVAWRGGWGLPRRIAETEQHLENARHDLATGEREGNRDLWVLRNNVEVSEKVLQHLLKLRG